MPPEQARSALGLPPGRYVVCVAHVLASKGMGELVRALPQLPADVRCLIVGGDMDRGGYRRQLLDLARQYGCGERVTFVDRQDQAKMPLYFGAADVSVLASYAEGCPNVVLESLACGRPVVATTVGDMERLIVPGRNGLLVPPRDSEALAGALKQALSQPWSADVIRTSGAGCSWSDVARRVHGVFQTVLATARPKA